MKSTVFSVASSCVSEKDSGFGETCSYSTRISCAAAGNTDELTRVESYSFYHLVVLYQTRVGIQFVLVSRGGVRLISLGTSVTIWSIVQAPDDG
jgi:hypothetical protein